MTTRCTGHCCERFFLPLSPDELRAEQADKGTIYNRKEIDFVADMVIYLGPSGTSVTGEPLTLEGKPVTGHFYTCRHYKDGNCTVYEQRPNICRDYPYGSTCKYKECTWSLEDQKANCRAACDREAAVTAEVEQAEGVKP
jgi:Fe-S-cluster containining protein